MDVEIRIQRSENERRVVQSGKRVDQVRARARIHVSDLHAPRLLPISGPTAEVAHEDPLADSHPAPHPWVGRTTRIRVRRDRISRLLHVNIYATDGRPRFVPWTPFSPDFHHRCPSPIPDDSHHRYIRNFSQTVRFVSDSFFESTFDPTEPDPDGFSHRTQTQFPVGRSSKSFIGIFRKVKMRRFGPASVDSS